MDTIVLASNNKHKIKEFREILKDYQILSLADIQFFEDIVEDGDTFFDNALIKAKTIHDYLIQKHYNYAVIADDSGLCVTSLKGEPGVHSARYAGNHDDKANRNRLITNLKEYDDKSAYFVCQLIYYPIEGEYISCQGKTSGKIIEEERGSDAFGYDCIFLSDDLGKTFGEASEIEKNSVSHRSRAIYELLHLLQQKNDEL